MIFFGKTETVIFLKDLIEGVMYSRFWFHFKVDGVGMVIVKG